MDLFPRDAAAWFLLLRERQQRYGRSRPGVKVTHACVPQAQAVSSSVRAVVPDGCCQENAAKAIHEAFGPQGRLDLLYRMFEQHLDEFNRLKGEMLLDRLQGLTQSQCHGGEHETCVTPELLFCTLHCKNLVSTPCHRTTQ